MAAIEETLPGNEGVIRGKNDELDVRVRPFDEPFLTQELEVDPEYMSQEEFERYVRERIQEMGIDSIQDLSDSNVTVSRENPVMETGPSLYTRIDSHLFPEAEETGEIGFLVQEGDVFTHLVDDIPDDKYEFHSELGLGYPEETVAFYDPAYLRTVDEGSRMEDTPYVFDTVARGNQRLLEQTVDLLLGTGCFREEDLGEMQDFDREDHMEYILRNLDPEVEGSIIKTEHPEAEVNLGYNPTTPTSVIRDIGDGTDAECIYFGVQVRGSKNSLDLEPGDLDMYLPSQIGSVRQEDYQDPEGWAGTTAVFNAIKGESETEQNFLGDYGTVPPAVKTE